jgi:hypothetical protein
VSESEDLRTFMRELLLRYDRRAEERERADIRRHQEAMARINEIREETREIIEEGRAQRQTLLRILDRLDGGGAAPA